MADIYRFGARVLAETDPELARAVGLMAMKLGLGPKGRAQRVWSSLFDRPMQSPVMIAAGVDKNLTTVKGWHKLGAGGVEYGTITGERCAGNAEFPRMWRDVEHFAMWNDLRLPNIGRAAFVERFDRKVMKKGRPANMVIGVSVASTALTRGEREGEYYEAGRALAQRADYVAIDKCPTVGASKTPVGEEEFLGYVEATRDGLESGGAAQTPIMVKEPPTVDYADLLRRAETMLKSGANGFIFCNSLPYALRYLTSSHTRANWPRNVDGQPVGCYSGLEGRKVARRMIATVRAEHPRVPLIGVHGIRAAEHAVELLEEGANAVQVCSGLASNPHLVEDINNGLVWWDRQKRAQEMQAAWPKKRRRLQTLEAASRA